MPLKAECDYCHTPVPVKIRGARGDIYVLPAGWSYLPAGVAKDVHDPVDALIACKEACLVRLHEIKTRAVGGDAARRGART